MASKLNPAPTSSPIAWVGGKSKLTAEIIPIMPAHRCYVEVFAGAAWLLFRKPISKTEVINDINGELVNMSESLSTTDKHSSTRCASCP